MLNYDSDGLSRELSNAIERAIGISVWPDPPPIKPWLGIIEALSTVFNLGGGVKSIYREERMVDAYCLYFFPVNVVRLIHFFSVMAEENPDEIDKVLSKERIVFWDLGCGPATASMAFALAFPHVIHKTNFALVDHNPGMLEKAGFVMKNMQTATFLKDAIRSNYEDIKTSEIGSADIVVMSNMIGEVDEIDYHAELGKKISDSMNPEGLWMIMEPALKDLSRGLLLTRDMLIKDFRILHPCTNGKLCPALKERDNWCHMGFKWERPEWIRILDRHLKFNKSELSYTPLVLTSGSGVKNEGYRVVSDTSLKKKDGEAFVCGERGLLKVKLDRSLAKKTRRGDILNESVFKPEKT